MGAVDRLRARWRQVKQEWDDTPVRERKWSPPDGSCTSYGCPRDAERHGFCELCLVAISNGVDP